ncbi:hypothetical protein B484DRAFT_417963, partial [Ochromonadaceae sp. CCMP2298]
MVCVWVCVGGAEVGVEAGAGAEAEAETESPDSRQNVGSVETVGAVVIVGLVGTVSVVVIFTVHMALPAIILWAPFLRRPETMSVESLSANDTVAMHPHLPLPLCLPLCLRLRLSLLLSLQLHLPLPLPLYLLDAGTTTAAGATAGTTAGVGTITTCLKVLAKEYSLLTPTSMAEAEAMMEEIRQYVSQQKAREAKTRAGASPQKSPTKSPYKQDMARALPSEDTTQRRPRQERARPTFTGDMDELLSHYAAQMGPPAVREEVDRRAVLLPYSVSRVSEYVNLDRQVNSAQNESSFRRYDADYERGGAGAGNVSYSSPVISSTNGISGGGVSGGTRGARGPRSPPPLPAVTPMTPPPLIPSLGLKGMSPPLRRHDSRFHRRFPRLCASFSFSDEDLSHCLSASERRGDCWMVRFMEDCYDEAYALCCTPSKHGRLRNGLDLGALQSFPAVVLGLLSARYSVLENRTRVLTSLLTTLETLADLGGGISGPAEHAVFHGGRASLFTSFLCEEYDVDILALFLHVREFAQVAGGFRLRDVNKSRVWVRPPPDEGADVAHRETETHQFTYYRVQQGQQGQQQGQQGQGQQGQGQGQAGSRRGSKRLRSHDPLVSPERRTGAGAGREAGGPKGPEAGGGDGGGDGDGDGDGGAQGGAQGGIKVVPYCLPSRWHFLADAGMVEAPLVGFDAALLPLLCVRLLPTALQAERTYLSDRVLEGVRAGTVRRVSDVAGVMDAEGRVGPPPPASVQGGVQGGLQGVQGGVTVVPLYVLLSVLCREGGKCRGQLEEGAVESASLQQLQGIYANNSERMRTLDEQVLVSQQTLAATHSRLLALQKCLRRLERKRAAAIASKDELTQIEESRGQCHSLSAELSQAQATLEALVGRRRELEGATEALWLKVTKGAARPSEAEEERQRKRARGGGVNGGGSVAGMGVGPLSPSGGRDVGG